MSDKPAKSNLPLEITDDDIYFIANGEHERAYEILGAHLAIQNGIEGVRFTAWAPNASAMSVVGSFNDWNSECHSMTAIAHSGIWTAFVAEANVGDLYKFSLRSSSGAALPLKADPYAFAMQKAPETASIIWDKDAYQWQDGLWMKERLHNEVNGRSKAISIYEVHLASWRRKDNNTYLSYQELAEQLIPYVVDLGFTHIELMPISEYPFDGSWGYQPVGMFAPTSRFGDPDGFKYLVDCCHQAGLAVLVDWVPAHFPSDEHGLGFFDGSHLYEHEDKRKGFHPDWNTLIYNYGRKEVATFLMSNALYWLEHFHIDGLRVDAVASMLYLDYSRNDGEWLPNEFGGRENLEAIALLKDINTRLFKNAPSASTFAEESTAWPNVSRPIHDGGLGFGYKWNMGWMHDSLQYMSKDPVYRQYHHDEITFGLSYAFSENFILPLSHDEVVHGKGSLLNKMPGDEWQRFANLRAYYGFMWSHPGKKLLFMGGEFAQQSEWNHDLGLSWEHLEDDKHKGIHTLIRDLNSLYRKEKPLHQFDCEEQGFEWLEASDYSRSIYAFMRKSSSSDESIIVLSNFTPACYDHYRLGVVSEAEYEVCFDSDDRVYGGSGYREEEKVKFEKQSSHGRPYSIIVRLPPLSTIILRKK